MSNYNKKYGENIHNITNETMKYLNDFFKQRNVNQSTINTYKNVLLAFHNYIYPDTSISTIISKYEQEQEKNIKMNKRSIYHDLLLYQEALLPIYSNSTIRHYLISIKAIFKFFYISIPNLPKMQQKIEYEPTYQDLPTHSEIKEACLKTDLLTRAIILFICSSGTALNELTNITVHDFLKGCIDYLPQKKINYKNVYDNILNLKSRYDIVPIIPMYRIKTKKKYCTMCSPEASYTIIEYLFNHEHIKINDKLFQIHRRAITERFTIINDKMNLGKVKYYAKFRAHSLRKFHASNLKVSADKIDALQGRAKNTVHDTYIKTDWEALREEYIKAMPSILIFDNFGQPYDLDNRGSKIQLGTAREVLNFYQLYKKNIISETQFNIIRDSLLSDIL